MTITKPLLSYVCRASAPLLIAALCAAHLSAQVSLIATGSLTQSSAGANTDLSGLNYKLENQLPANLLGGLGSGLAHASGNTFLALPDRGPNATPYNSNLDDTTSYISRFHTLTLELHANTSVTGLPFTLAPRLRATTLLWAREKLSYGKGTALGVGPGAPVVNTTTEHFFTGRSDNYEASKNSGNTLDARFDTESIRVSNDLATVFISDEYGPYIYQFNRETGQRVKVFKAPDNFFVPLLSPLGANEIANNTTGRTANKGMEGLAITPDGRTLVGIMQAALLQDANQTDAKGKKPAANLLRILTFDIASGLLTHQYAYLLTTGTGVSEIVAINNHEFLVDERDGRGREGGNNLTSNDARVKQLFKIDLNGAVDVGSLDGIGALPFAVKKTLFLDLVSALVAAGFDATKDIPSKIEGVTFGTDVTAKDAQGNAKTLHTLWIANDNDFVLTTNDVPPLPNPNQFFVFGFTDADLAGSQYAPQFH